ncbi:MAG: hypothetical protein M1450_03735 [Patescibacteria group bacterium]|nr:hypothetical protein [Patescibacteria group bacterium]
MPKTEAVPINIQSIFPQLGEGEAAPLSVDFSRLFDPALEAKFGKKPNVVMGWAAALAHSPLLREEFSAHRIEYRTAMGEVLQILGVRSPDEIISSFQDGRKTAKQAAAHRRIAQTYSIGTKTEKESRRAEEIRKLGKNALYIIAYLRFGVLEPVAQKIRMTEEVTGRNDPIELLELIFTPGYAKQVRFEAKRKLFLMAMAAAVQLRRQESGEGNKYGQFIDFLNKHIWDREQAMGVTRDTYILSRHSLKDYSVLRDKNDKPLIEEVPNSRLKAARAEALANSPTPEERGYYQRLTVLQQRVFRHRGQLIPAYISPRGEMGKEEESQILKMLGKGEENPAVAIQDYMGMIVVVKDTDAVVKFMDHLQEAGAESGSLLRIEGIENTLDGKPYRAKRPGSSPKTRMLKFFARVHGMRMEIIVHTYDSYLDYYHSDATGHKEFEINRLFDPEANVFSLLFPEYIYGESGEDVRPETIKKELLDNARQSKRNSRIS